MQKICTKCYKEKTDCDFYYSKRGSNRLRASCKQCDIEKAKKWCKNNLDKHNAIVKKWQDNNKEIVKNNKKDWIFNNKDRVKENKKRWEEDNKDNIKTYHSLYYEENKAHIKVNIQKWKIKNPLKVRFSLIKRKKRISQATPKWLTEDHFKQIEEFYIKANRLTRETGIKHEVDHIHPLKGKTMCGLHVPWNLQVLTKSENAKKHNLISNLPILEKVDP